MPGWEASRRRLSGASRGPLAGLLALSAMACTQLGQVPATPETAAYSNVCHDANATPPEWPVASRAVPWHVDLKGISEDQALAWRGSPGTASTAPAEDENKSFVALALSGGGTRAAVFATAVMLELERRRLLRHVDLVTALSGGSIAAARYAISDDVTERRPTPGARRPGWCSCPDGNDPDAAICPTDVHGDWWARCEEALFTPLTHDYLGDLAIRYTLNPGRYARGLATYYDRTDLLAGLFGERLFGGLTFEDVCARRPNLIITTTNLAAPPGYPHLPIGELDEMRKLYFPLTTERFRQVLGSDLAHLRLGYGVAASNAFPGVFQNVTLADFSERDCGDGAPNRFVHLMDGGLFDRTATHAVIDAYDHSQKNARGRSAEGRPGRPSHLLVLTVEAAIPTRGLDLDNPESRSTLSRFFIIDMNFLDSSNTLLDIQSAERVARLNRFRDETAKIKGMKAVHVQFRLYDLVGADDVLAPDRNDPKTVAAEGKPPLDCRPFDDYAKLQRGIAGRNGDEQALFPDWEAALKRADDKLLGKTALDSDGPVPEGLRELRENLAGWRKDEKGWDERVQARVGRLHLWCDIVRETATTLSLSRQSAADIRVAASVLVKDVVDRRCRDLQMIAPVACGRDDGVTGSQRKPSKRQEEP